jgi:hypothetical protein
MKKERRNLKANSRYDGSALWLDFDEETGPIYTFSSSRHTTVSVRMDIDYGPAAVMGQDGGCNSQTTDSTPRMVVRFRRRCFRQTLQSLWTDSPSSRVQVCVCDIFCKGLV